MNIPHTDIERLHSVELRGRALCPRRAGATYAMLVEAAQCSEFPPTRVMVVSSSSKLADRMVDDFYRVAEELGYKVESRKKREVTLTNGAKYLFVSDSDLPQAGTGKRLTKILSDHYQCRDWSHLEHES